MASITYNGNDVDYVKVDGVDLQSIKFCTSSSVAADPSLYYYPEYRPYWENVWKSSDNTAPDASSLKYYILSSSWESSEWMQNGGYTFTDPGGTLSSHSKQIGLPEFSSQNLIYIEGNTDGNTVSAGLYHWPDSYYTKYSYDLYFNVPHIQRFDKDFLCLNAIYGNSWPRAFYFFDLTFDDGHSTAVNTQTSAGMAKLSAIHYTDATSYAINGQYSTKVVHVPADASQITLELNKYNEVLPYVTEDWHESGYMQAAGKCAGGETASSDYCHKTAFSRYFSVQTYPQIWHDLIGDAAFSTAKSSKVAVSDIVSDVDADNNFDVQRLTFHTTDNDSGSFRYQFLGYSYGADSTVTGYHPELECSRFMSKFIFVQDPKDDPVVYFGFAPIFNSALSYNYPHDPVIHDRYLDYTLENKETCANFDVLGYAKWSTVQEWGYELFNTDYGISVNCIPEVYCVYYVAVPTSIPYVPNMKFTNAESRVDTTAPSSAFSLARVKNGQASIPSSVKFNGTDYTLYMFAELYGQYLYPLYGYIDKIYLEPQS